MPFGNLSCYYLTGLLNDKDLFKQDTSAQKNTTCMYKFKIPIVSYRSVSCEEDLRTG